MPKTIPMQTLEQDELERILEAAENESLRDYAFLLLLALTGRRVSEALAIHLKDIDFYNKTIRFPLLKRRKEAYQIVPVSEKLLKVLRQYIEEYNIEDPNEKVFPFSRTIALEICHKYGELAGIGHNVYPHMFRHTFASRFLEKLNKPHEIYVLKEILGHSKIETTMRYLHVNLPKQREIIETIANAIGLGDVDNIKSPAKVETEKPQLDKAKEVSEYQVKKETELLKIERMRDYQLKQKIKKFLEALEEDEEDEEETNS